MDQSALELEIERCEREANKAKENGDFNTAFMKLDMVRRLRERHEKNTPPQAEKAGVATT